MKPDLIAFVVGGILLITAIVGGGLELKELKIPRIGMIARLVAAFAGGIFVIIGIGLTLNNSDGDAQHGSVAHAETESIDFSIQNTLGYPDSISEQADVIIAGRRVGTMTVDAFHPDTTLTVTLPASGRYDYTLSSLTQFADDTDAWEMRGSGQGTIQVSKGKTFHVEGAEGAGGIITLTLVEGQYSES